MGREAGDANGGFPRRLRGLPVLPFQGLRRPPALPVSLTLCVPYRVKTEKIFALH